MELNKNQTEEAIKYIAEAAKLLGWNITFDSTSKDVEYIILAKPEKIDELIDKLNDSTT